MGKQGSKQADGNLPFGRFGYQFRYQKMVQVSDPTMGRRMSGGDYQWDKLMLFDGLRNNSTKFGSFKGANAGKRHTWLRKHIQSIVFTIGLMGFLFLLDSLMCSVLEPTILQNSSTRGKFHSKRDIRTGDDEGRKTSVQMYDRLADMASGALVEREFKQDESKFWKESYTQASVWQPCADRKESTSAGKLQSSTGFILVSANGGLNQQRVAVCNAVAVASLLNATLVIPRFLYSNVWKDPRSENLILVLSDFISFMWYLKCRLHIAVTRIADSS